MVPVKSLQLTSITTLIPYDYYELPFCPPVSSASDPLDLGSLLMGVVQKTTPYDIKMKVNRTCTTLCNKTLTKKDINKFAKFIKNNYRASWNIDGLPVLYNYDDKFVRTTFPVGYVIPDEKEKIVLFNHVNFLIKYHVTAKSTSEYYFGGFFTSPDDKKETNDEDKNSKGQFRVVGAQITLESRGIPECAARDIIDTPGTSPYMSSSSLLVLDPSIEGGAEDVEEDVQFSYSVQWEESSISWASRWDIYIDMGSASGTAYGNDTEQTVHWVGMLTSAFVTLTLIVICVRLALRATIGATQRDIAEMIVGAFEAGDSGNVEDEDSIEAWSNEIGWKVIAGEVFRKPPMFAYLCVFIGNGMQLLCISVCTAFLGLLGLASPSNRAAVFYLALVAFSFTGGISGFIGGAFCRLFNQDFSIRAPKFALYNCLGFPLVAMFAFLLVDFVLWTQKSSAAVSLSVVLNLALPWIFFSTPCVLVGAWISLYKLDKVKVPYTVKPLPREIPRQSWMKRTFIACLAGGYSIWLVVSLEVTFIVRSVWTREFYSLFGFLFVTLMLFILTSATVGVVATYVAVAGENWKWWWRSFIVPASGGVFLFLQTMLHLVNIDRGSIHIAAFTIYSLYSFLLCSAVGIMAGAMGTLASFFFLRRIYSTCRVD